MCFLTYIPWLLTSHALSLLQARTLLQPVGGVVHHVHMAAGGRVSYGPYRDVSKQLIARLRKFVGVGIIEKASIDEAYIQCMMEAQHSDPAPMNAMQQAAQIAETIRRTGIKIVLIQIVLQALPLACVLTLLTWH